MLQAADASVTDEETDMVIKILATRGARDPVAVLRKEIASGNGYILITEARHRLDRAAWQQEQPGCDRDGPQPHSGACRRGDSQHCTTGWCECACHGPRQVQP